MKKRISTRAVCLLIAAVMLIGALTVSAINGSPYVNLKNAAINALFYENFSMGIEFVRRVDGQLHERASIRSYVTNEGSFTISSSYSPWRDILEDDTHNPREWVSYTSQYFSIHSNFSDEDGTRWYVANMQPPNFTLPQSIGHEIFGAAGRDSNHLRLAELGIDFFSGDLKNNLTMSSQGDGIRRISGAITESQLPEIVRVLLDVALDDQLRLAANDTRQIEDFDNVLSIPIRELSIDRIQGMADIDTYGNLLYVNVLGIVTVQNIFGYTHVIEVEVTLRFYDIGTTIHTNPFTAAADVLKDAFNRWPNHQPRIILHFTLDEDGNIDAGSITSQRP